MAIKGEKYVDEQVSYNMRAILAVTETYIETFTGSLIWVECNWVGTLKVFIHAHKKHYRDLRRRRRLYDLWRRNRKRNTNPRCDPIRQRETRRIQPFINVLHRTWKRLRLGQRLLCLQRNALHDGWKERQDPISFEWRRRERLGESPFQRQDVHQRDQTNEGHVETKC